VGTGSIVISGPIGNGITYSIGNGYQSGTTFSNLAPGNYTITAKSLDGCVSTGTVKTVNQQPATPDAPTLCVTQPSLCGPSTGSITVLSPAAGTGHLYSIDNGQNWHQTTEFSGLAAGSNPSVLVKNSAGCISSASNCSDATTCNSNTVVSNSTAPVTENRAQNNLGSATLESSVTVTATPNPFTSKVRFTITASKSGRGVLDVYNIQGQKIKTVYQGYIQAGVNYFDLSLPATRNSQLVYVLTMGEERISGKMLQMGNR
jgi:hypothetical protein